MATSKIDVKTSFWSSLWWAAWLFTIGFMHLDFWGGFGALFVWPAYWGYYVAGLM